MHPKMPSNSNRHNRSPSEYFALVALLFFASSTIIRAQSDAPVTSAQTQIRQPPCPPPSIQYRDLLPSDQNVPHRLGLIPFSIGQPTDEEQLYMEYINRMRANPTAEGQLLAVTSDSQVLSAY